MEETQSFHMGRDRMATTAGNSDAAIRVSTQLAVIIRNFSIHNMRASRRILMIRARRSAGNKASSTSSRLDWVMSMIKPSGYLDRIRVKFARGVALLIPIR
jgi:hypothetical protein